MTEAKLQQHCRDVLSGHQYVFRNPSRPQLIRETIQNKEAVVISSGALATWTPVESTGRRPQDTYIVKRPESEHAIDWTSVNNNPMDPEVFDRLLRFCLERLKQQQSLYVVDRVVGADSRYALPVTVITSRALTALFADTMFRPVPEDITASLFHNKRCTVIVLPDHTIDPHNAQGLRSTIAIAMDMDRRMSVVIGSSYCGTVKKLIFTVMNYLLPAQGILPLHCSANEGARGDVALMLGLSGTGKTTLSADPDRLFIGDDEHSWSQYGIANFEYGCYAKLIHLKKDKEPDIFHALFDKHPVEENGCIIENALLYPNGTFDLDDERLTENSRGSLPISFLPNIKREARCGHPTTMIFLTADAHGVLPPVARLSLQQAVVWFLLGYTSKLAGTEIGVKEPQAAFSRFFGQPFMPRQPHDYTNLFQHYIKQYNTDVYLVNTGWSGGPYGVGKRMDITLTRSIVRSAINGQIRNAGFQEDKRWHFSVPTALAGVERKILDPRQTWNDPEDFDRRSDELATSFAAHFDKQFGQTITDPDIVSQCPGH